jgi:Glycosyl transferase family 11
MFQYAATRALALEHNTEYYFDTRGFRKHNEHQNGTRRIELQQFKYAKLSVITRDVDVTQLATVYDDFNYKQIPDHSLLDGFWQSEKYFKKYSSTIRQEFAFEQSLKQALYGRYPALHSDTILLHVRRGDYVGDLLGMYSNDVTYHKSAYDALNDTRATVIIVSDDIDWCKTKFKFANMVFVDNETDFDTLCLMSLCKHAIISNSTFGWWGAWLIDNPNKKIVAPKVWLPQPNPTNWSDQDIVPDEWIRI